ncbi:MAG: hypothetical protein ACRDI3_08905 [Actinomycetota bacterium]
MKKLCILLTVTLFAGAACWLGSDEPLAEMSVRNEDGSVRIHRENRVIEVRDKDVPVEPGDIIETRKFGVASLRLEDDRQVWISGATLERAETRVVSTSSLEGRTGTILAHAGDAMKVRFGSVVASADEASFRIDQKAGGARAASLQGTVRLTAPGEPTMQVDRLFEVPVSAGDLRADRPYQLNVDDPFDKRELARVVDLQTQLQQLSAGFASQLGRQKPDLPYFRALGDRTRVDPIKPYLKRRTIDLLTAFTIATNTKEYSFGEAIEEAFRHHDAGGSWAVVAEILRSKPSLLLADLSDIIVATGAVADGSGEEAQFTVAAGEAADDGTTVAPIDNGGGGNDGGGNDGDGNDGGGGGEDDEPEECTSGPECDVNEIRDRIFPSPSPSSITDDIIDR